MVFAEIADGAVVRPEISGEPDEGEIRGAGVLEAAAGFCAVEIAPKVDFDKGGGVEAAASEGVGGAGFEAEVNQVEGVDEGIDDTDRTLGET